MAEAGTITAPCSIALPVRSRAHRAAASEARHGVALVAPAVMLMLALLFGPTAAAIVISFTDWEFGAASARFVGIANFEALVADGVFWRAFGNTLLYAGIVVPACVCGGLALALLIESTDRFRAFYRTAHFLPVMSTLVAMAVVWQTLLHPTIGLLNQVLGVIGLEGRNWLRDEGTALLALAAIGIWQNLGFTMVLFMAGLKSIPRDLYHAADIDGADSILDRFRTVTLPLLGPVMMFVLVMMAIRSFQVFETVRVLTKGGPNKASEVLLHLIYVESFEFLHTGHGAALTVVFLAVVVVLTMVQTRIVEKRVHYA
jgi:multiple sugar transport system permease protein